MCIRDSPATSGRFAGSVAPGYQSWRTKAAKSSSPPEPWTPTRRCGPSCTFMWRPRHPGRCWPMACRSLQAFHRSRSGMRPCRRARRKPIPMRGGFDTMHCLGHGLGGRQLQCSTVAQARRGGLQPGPGTGVRTRHAQRPGQVGPVSYTHLGEYGKIATALLTAYRWQYIVSGVQDRRFSDLLMSMITPTQSQRVQAALQPLMA